jgi:hypothetical protein
MWFQFPYLHSHSGIPPLKDLSTRRTFIGLLMFMLVSPYGVPLEGRTPSVVRIAELTQNIPARAPQDLTGSQFVRYVAQMNPQQREQAIEEEILKGNLPGFLRKLVPVELSCALPHGKSLIATIFVAPDYLAIGSDRDFLRIPMNLHSAVTIADHFGFILPTKKMVDAIYLQSRFHFAPQPLPAGPEMRSTLYYWTHNQDIEQQARALGVRLGALVSGDKKDIVITSLLSRNPGRIAIYGWHRRPGDPIQPLSTVHGANYADYSHGVRLVSNMALLNGELRSVYDILRDSTIARVLSDEGPIPNIWGSLSTHPVSQTIAPTSIN